MHTMVDGHIVDECKITLKKILTPERFPELSKTVHSFTTYCRCHSRRHTCQLETVTKIEKNKIEKKMKKKVPSVFTL